MKPAGYSGIRLIKKLGIKPGTKILIFHAPENYMHLLDADLSHQLAIANEIPDLIHLFAGTYKIFLKEMKPILKLCKKNTSIIIWVSWYKKSSGKATDLTENLIREFALQNNLVDIKVCAVSDDWSGLKLVVPLTGR